MRKLVGYVVDSFGDFHAHLFDENGVLYDATLNRSLISESDLPLLQDGACFYLKVENGVATFDFVKGKSLSVDEVRKLMDEANDLHDKLKWD